MTGVSYMIPFVAAGGILIALGFLFGGEEIVYKLYGGTCEGVDLRGHRRQPARGFTEGRRTSTLCSRRPDSPACCSSSARSRSSCWCRSCPASSPSPSRTGPAWCPASSAACWPVAIGAGFLGGLVSGFTAGGLAYCMTRLKVPKGVRGVMPVVVIPLVSTFVIGLFMIFVVGKPIAAADARWLTDWLTGLAGASAILLGVILGLMMGFDMGGPINKVGLHLRRGRSDHRHRPGRPARHPALQIMAAVMAAGMTPPLGMALATAVRKKLWTEAGAGERPGLLAARRLVHHRGCDPVRRRPPAAGHPVVHGRLRGHRRAGDGLRQRAARPARRHLGRCR